MISAFSLLPKKYFKEFKLSLPAKSIACGFVMVAVIWALNALNVLWILQAVIGLSVYLGGSLLLDVITQNEFHFFKNYLVENQPFSFLKTKTKQI